MVIDRHAEFFLCPFNRVRIRPFPCKVERAQSRQVVFGDERAFGVFALYRADGSRRGKEAAHIVFFDDAPESACVGRADGFALEHDCGVARNQRPVGDVAVSHDPAHI